MAYSYDDINNLYNQHLGRSASQDEYQNWANGTYGSDPTGQIAGSGEAQAYKQSQRPPTSNTQPATLPVPQSTTPGPTNNYGAITDPGGRVTNRINPITGQPLGPNDSASITNLGTQLGPAGGAPVSWTGRSNDDQQILGRIAQWSQRSGSNASLKNNPNYWLQRVKDTGGLGSDNDQYWSDLSMRPEGAAEGGSVQGGKWVSNSNNGGSNTGGSTFNSSFSTSNPYQAHGDTLMNLLMSRAQQSENVTSDDPIIRSQTDAYRNEQTRASREYLAAAAERNGANANLDAETRAAGEKVGQQTSGFEAQLMGRELDARRQEIQSALSGAQGYLTAQQQMQLTAELHRLDLAQNESQFGRNLSQRSYEFDSNRDDRNLGGN